MKEMLMHYLEKTGKKAEFDLFLQTYQEMPREKFAVIKISGATIDKHLDLLAEDIAFLNKLGIYPIIVHGAGSVLDARLPNSKKIDGIRVTEKEDLTVIKDTFAEVAEALSQKIQAHGGNAKVLLNIFSCERMQKYGYVGKITTINAETVKQTLQENITPIISPIGTSADGELNINADTAAKELVKILETKKFILLTETGGVLDEKGQLISFLNLSNDDDFGFISGGMLLKVKEIRDFLRKVEDCAVVITSAENLLKEIFTIKGSGTFIKYHRIKSTTDITTIIRKKMKALLEDAFGKKLVDTYFEGPFLDIIYEKDYEGAAIMKTVHGLPYLDKFAVAKAYQGTGLGKSLWNEVIKKYPSLVWRAAVTNAFNEVYTRYCDGMIKGPEWIVFWKGLEMDRVIPCIDEIMNKEKTMVAVVL